MALPTEGVMPGQWVGLLVARFLCFSSVALYGLSFLLPTFDIVVGGEASTSYGYDAFLVGLLSPLNSFLFGLDVFVPWLANPMLWLGLAAFARGRSRAAC